MRIEARVTFALAALNPAQAARLALLSGLESDLGSLGPVGFFLSHRLGAKLLLASVQLWPFLVGGFAWAAACFSFKRRDLV